MASLSLVFDILARDRASTEFRKIGDAADDAGKRTTGFGSSIGGAMKVAAGALAGVGIVSFFKDAITGASNMNETLNKANVIFGANAAKVQQWASGSAKNFGLSRQAALEAASGFGNMLQQLGYTGEAAVEASTGTVKLAADLGSFNNLDTGDVLERIGAAMRGEYDSLQLLIPNINAARVEQEAMAMTGKTAASSLTAQEKAAATLAIVQRDGAAAQNDFAETSDGLANRTKIAAAQFEDAKTAIGQAFLPAMTAAMGFITTTAIPALSNLWSFLKDNVFPAFVDFAKLLYENKEIVATLAVVFGVLRLAVMAHAASMAVAAAGGLAAWLLQTNLISAAVKTWTAVQWLLNVALTANPIGIVIALVAALVAGVVIAYQKSETFRKIVDGAFRAVAEAGRWMWENVLKPAFAALQAVWNAVGTGISWVWNNVIRPVFNAFSSVITSVRDGFGAAVDGIGRMWEGLKSKLSAPVQWVIDVVWNNGLRRLWNTVNNLWGGDDIAAFSFAKGGYTGDGGKYQPAGIVHAGEYVMTQEQVKRLGVRNLEALANGEILLPGYADGGLVTLPGWLSTALKFIPGMGAISDIVNALNGSSGGAGGGLFGSGLLGLAKTIGSKLLDKAMSLFGGGDGATSGGTLGSGALGGSWQSIWNAVKAAIPQARINSTYRPGDPGYHGRGKAIDFGFGSGPGGAGSPGLAAINRFLHDGFGSSLAELIYDGLGDDRPDLKNGRPLTYSAATRAQHANHVHAAVYDGGGLLPPGLSVAYNGTGQNETIRTAEQERALRQGSVVNIHTSDNPRAIVRALAAHNQLQAALAPAW